MGFQQHWLFKLRQISYTSSWMHFWMEFSVMWPDAYTHTHTHSKQWYSFPRRLLQATSFP